MKSKKFFLSLLLCVFFALTANFVFATDYHIGTGQTYTTISAFASAVQPLSAGDHVYIHAGTYKEMLFLRGVGTASNHIVIEGVPDAEGNLPVLDGDDMVIPPAYDGHLSEYDLGGGKLAQGYGMIFMHWDSNNYGVEPEYYEIKNLEIKNTTSEAYTMTNSNGVVQGYPGGNAGVYVKTGSHILLENLTIHDVGNGLETQGVDKMIKDVTIRGCHLYDFGRTDSRADREHGMYNEVSGLVVEYCKIGPARIGTAGSSIKDRGADTVIRYNTIYSTARAIDLVEPQNQGGSSGCEFNNGPGPMYLEPGFDKTWVYGNLIIDGLPSGHTTSGNMIHYGGDNCPNLSRAGTLYFYNNTIFQNTSSYYTRVFDITSPNETIELYNNVIYNTGTTTDYYVGNTSSDNYSTGTYNFRGGNWITSGYLDIYPGDGGTWNETATILDGANTGVLNDPMNEDYTIPSGSPLINAGVALPSSITTAHNVTVQYKDPQTYEIRTDTDDIGAFTYGTGGAVPTCSDGIRNQDETGVDCGGSCTLCPHAILTPPLLHPVN